MHNLHTYWSSPFHLLPKALIVLMFSNIFHSNNIVQLINFLGLNKEKNSKNQLEKRGDDYTFAMILGKEIVNACKVCTTKE